MNSPYADHRCPWFAIRKCPLYIASHVGAGLGCVDDMVKPCLVTRGEMNYHHGVLELVRAGMAINAEQFGALQPGGSA